MEQKTDERYQFIVNNIKSRDFSISKKKDVLIKLLSKGEINHDEYTREFSSLIYEITSIYETFKNNLSTVNQLSLKDPESEYEFIMQYIEKFILVRKNQISSNYKHNVLNDKVVDTVLNIQDIELNKDQGIKNLVLINEEIC